MTFAELARKRRSIRVFQEAVVPDELIEKILEAGNLAPSAHNKQSWRFLVIRGEKKERLAGLVAELSELYPKASRMLLRMAAKSVRTSSHVIAVFSTGELMRETARYEDDARRQIRGFFREMEIQSASAAVQNMLLQAAELDLGAVWLGIVVLIARQIECFLDADATLLALVPIGYPSREYVPPRKKTLAEVVMEVS